MYDQRALDDDQEFSDLSMSERLAAEREMRKREREEAVATGRMRPGILYGGYRTGYRSSCGIRATSGRYIVPSLMLLTSLLEVVFLKANWKITM